MTTDTTPSRLKIWGSVIGIWLTEGGRWVRLWRAGNQVDIPVVALPELISELQRIYEEGDAR